MLPVFQIVTALVLTDDASWIEFTIFVIAIIGDMIRVESTFTFAEDDPVRGHVRFRLRLKLSFVTQDLQRPVFFADARICGKVDHQT